MQQERRSEANGTAARRKRAYQSCVDEGLAKGRAEAQKKAYQNGVDEGLGSLAKDRAEAQEKVYQKGFEEGKKLEHATSQSTHDSPRHEALPKYGCNLQIKLASTTSDLHTKLANTASRKEFEATATAADFVVQCQQLDNRIAELECK